MLPINSRARAGISPGADAFAGTVTSECINLKNYKALQALVVRGDSDAAAASLTSGTSNAQLVISWGTVGEVGNGKTVEIIASGNNTPLSVVVDETSVVINVETDGMGDEASSVTEVIAELEADETFAAFWVASTGTGDGSGTLVAASEDVLAGGTDPGSSLITVEKCSSIAGANAEAIPFYYRKIDSSDTYESFTLATAAGFTTELSDNVIYEILVPDSLEGLAEGDKTYLRIKAVEDNDVAVDGAIVLIAKESRFGEFGSIL